MKTVLINGSNEAKSVVLALLGKTVDQQGFIVELSTGERVTTQTGEELTLRNFTGVRPGSEVFFTSDLPSLLEQSEYIKD